MTTATMEPTALKEGTLGTLAGTGKLLRFQTRRTRVFIIGWFVGLVGFSWLIAAAFPSLYPNAEDRAEFAVTLDTPAMRSMTGPGEYLDAFAESTGAMFAQQMILWVGAITAVMFILLVTRLTRADEETSRLEVIRSEPVGRRADLAASMILAVLVAVLIGAGMAVSVLGMQGVDAGGALLYGLGYTSLGIVFACLTAVAAQLAAYQSSANGLGFAALGATVLLAAIGNAQENWVTWLSPVGWSQLTFVSTPDQRWWPLALTLGVGAIALWVAFALVTHRDFGAGMLPYRPGRAEAKPGLGSAGALTFRLTRGLMWAGVISLVLLAAAYGSIVGSADDMLSGLSEDQQAVLNQGGASMEENFASTIAAIDGLFAALFGLLVVGRARKEETGGRGELLASGPVARSGWPGSYLPAALVVATVATAAGGLILGLTGAASTGDGAFFGKLLGASLIQLPAIWVLTAFAFTMYAWLPRAGWLRWIAWIYAFVVAYYGELLELSSGAQGISPFYHVSAYPAQDIDWLALIVLTVVAALIAAIGYLGVRRRNLHFS
ncbi:ABC transporter permease [Glycomyces buryatensis]|uniref:ABC transporter permease n=1 Tax=Glycomyces buryatensis TaxID=2570927 RepID=A0A4S8PZM0_9ACTN|nr:ABC transporter permease [Glycomyces buryatensis]THV35625.1 ABC transporter permease [Glycomyces buryatensis]